MINQYNVNIPQNYDMSQLYNTNIFDSSPIDTNMARTVLKMQLKDIQQRLLNQVLLDEAKAQLLADKYERMQSRLDYRNSYYSRYITTSFGDFELKVPRARAQKLQFCVFDTYKRRWKEIDYIFLEAFIGGMSSRTIAKRLANALGTGQVQLQ